MGTCGMNNNPKKVNIQSTRTQSNIIHKNESSNIYETKASREFKDFEEFNSKNKKI